MTSRVRWEAVGLGISYFFIEGLYSNCWESLGLTTTTPLSDPRRISEMRGRWERKVPERRMGRSRVRGGERFEGRNQERFHHSHR